MFLCVSHDEKTVRDVGTRQCFSSFCPVGVPQVSLLCTSALAMLSSCHLLGDTSDVVAGVVISAAAYSVLTIVANNVVLTHINLSRAGPSTRLRALLGYRKLYAIILIIAWALTFAFELVVDLSLDEAIWTDASLLQWELMRIISGGLSLALSFAMWILLEVHRSPFVQAIPDLETQLPTHHSAPKHPFPASSFTLASKLSPLSLGSSHPRLQRVSSTPTLPSFTGQPLSGPRPRLAPSSIAAVNPPIRASPHKKSRLYCPASKSLPVAINTTSDQSLQRKSSSVSTSRSDALTSARGARMASVRRAPITRSFSSGSTRESRLQIMETVNEPDDGGEDLVENKIPTVPAIEVPYLKSQASCRDSGSCCGSVKPATKSTENPNMKPRKGKFSDPSRNFECGQYPVEMQPHLLNLIDLDIKDRPLPPLPLLITKRIYVNQALHIASLLQRTQSRVSKTARLVPTDSDITKRAFLLHRESQRESYGYDSRSLEQREEHYHDHTKTRSAAHGRRTINLGLNLEDRDLFRLSLMREILFVGR